MQKWFNPSDLLWLSRYESLEMILLFFLEKMQQALKVDRVALLSEEGNIWVNLVDSVGKGFSSPPGIPYVYDDLMCFPKTLQPGQWIFTPQEGFGFDALYPFKVKEKKFLLGVDDTSQARSFNFDDTELLRVAGNFLQNILQIFEIDIVTMFEPGPDKLVVGLGNRAALKKALLAGLSDQTADFNLLLIDFPGLQKNFACFLSCWQYGHLHRQIFEQFAIVLVDRFGESIFRVGLTQFGIVKQVHASGGNVPFSQQQIEDVVAVFPDFWKNIVKKHLPNIGNGQIQINMGLARAFHRQVKDCPIIWQEADHALQVASQRGPDKVFLFALPQPQDLGAGELAFVGTEDTVVRVQEKTEIRRHMRPMMLFNGGLHFMP